MKKEDKKILDDFWVKYQKIHWQRENYIKEMYEHHNNIIRKILTSKRVGAK